MRRAIAIPVALAVTPATAAFRSERRRHQSKGMRVEDLPESVAEAGVFRAAIAEISSLCGAGNEQGDHSRGDAQHQPGAPAAG
jgi:hypothetical protein